MAINGIGLLPTPLCKLIQPDPLALCFFFVLSDFVLLISYRHRVIADAKARRASGGHGSFIWIQHISSRSAVSSLSYSSNTHFVDLVRGRRKRQGFDLHLAAQCKCKRKSERIGVFRQWFQCHRR